MLKGIQTVLGIFLLVVLTVGCQAMSGQTAGAYVDDTTITTGVKAKLANNQVSSLSRVEVETVNGVVHLTGIVKSSEDKAQAARVASSVDGVKRVDNDLTIQ